MSPFIVEWIESECRKVGADMPDTETMKAIEADVQAEVSGHVIRERYIHGSPLANTAEAHQRRFFDDFKNYGLLLNTMTPEQFATEIGTHFRDPYQSAIVTTLMARLIALEAKYAEDPA